MESARHAWKKLCRSGEGITQGLQLREDRFLSYLTSVKTIVTRIYIYIGHHYINLEYIRRGLWYRDRSLLSSEWARFNSPPFSFLGLIAFHVYNMAQRENSKKRRMENGKVSGPEINVWFNDTISETFRVPPRSLRRSFCRTLFSPFS